MRTGYKHGIRSAAGIPISGNNGSSGAGKIEYCLHWHCSAPLERTTAALDAFTTILCNLYSKCLRLIPCCIHHSMWNLLFCKRKVAIFHCNTRTHNCSDIFTNANLQIRPTIKESFFSPDLFLFFFIDVGSLQMPIFPVLSVNLVPWIVPVCWIFVVIYTRHTTFTHCLLSYRKLSLFCLFYYNFVIVKKLLLAKFQLRQYIFKSLTVRIIRNRYRKYIVKANNNRHYEQFAKQIGLCPCSTGTAGNVTGKH